MRLLTKGVRTLAWTISGLALGICLAGPGVAQDPGALPTVPDAAAPADAAPVQQAPALSERVVASVNDDIISSYDLQQRMRLLAILSGTQPTADNMQQLQREALQSLVEDRLKLQELRREEQEQKFPIIATDADVDDEIGDTAKSNNMTTQQLLGALAQQGVAAETYRTQIRAELSWQNWIRGRYGSRLRIGEDQIKAFQARAAAEADKPRYYIGVIFVDAQRSGGVSQAMDEATQLVSQLRQGAPFAAVAKQFSADATSANGGDAGWVTAGEFPAEVDKALEQMKPNSLSAPIQTKDGAYIVYMREKQAAGGSLLISLKQAAIAMPSDAPQAQSDAARAKLEALRPQLHGCDNFETIASKVEGVKASDLGEADSKDLLPAFHDVAVPLAVGQVSQVFRSDYGWHLIAVCNRRTNGAESLTHDQIENRLFGAQLQMISRRYLRDLTNSASIEIEPS
jgi:peptidyl-prolyl cis-trans isomerase SurA